MNEVEMVCNNVVKIMEARGINSFELSKVTGLPYSTIKTYYSPKKFKYGPHIHSIIKVANALGCSINDLFVGTVDPEKFKSITEWNNSWPFNLVIKILDLEGETSIEDVYKANIPGLLKALDESYTDYSLTDKERKVIYMRYEHYMTLDAIAEVFNLSRERIRQIERKSFQKLKRNPIWDHKTDEDLLQNNPRISVRTTNILGRAGIKRLSEVAGMTKEELLKIREIGPKAAKEILDVVASYKEECHDGK